MTIEEIRNLLPEGEQEVLDCTIPQMPHEPSRRRLFRVRDEVEKLWRATGSAGLFEVMQILPNDPAHFEQVIAAAEGQQVIRQRIEEAREMLKNLGLEGTKNVEFSETESR